MSHIFKMLSLFLFQKFMPQLWANGRARSGPATISGYFLMISSSFFNSETQEVAGQREKVLGKTEAFQKGSLRGEQLTKVRSTDSPRHRVLNVTVIILLNLVPHWLTKSRKDEPSARKYQRSSGMRGEASTGFQSLLLAPALPRALTAAALSTVGKSRPRNKKKHLFFCSQHSWNFGQTWEPDNILGKIMYLLLYNPHQN